MEENERFEKVVNEINTELSRLASLKLSGVCICDYSDIGNAIGIIIESNKDDNCNTRNDFEFGLRHGYSLVDGTHGHSPKQSKFSKFKQKIRNLFYIFF